MRFGKTNMVPAKACNWPRNSIRLCKYKTADRLARIWKLDSTIKQGSSKRTQQFKTLTWMMSKVWRRKNRGYIPSVVYRKGYYLKYLTTDMMIQFCRGKQIWGKQNPVSGSLVLWRRSPVHRRVERHRRASSSPQDSRIFPSFRRFSRLSSCCQSPQCVSLDWKKPSKLIKKKDLSAGEGFYASVPKKLYYTKNILWIWDFTVIRCNHSWAEQELCPRFNTWQVSSDHHPNY